MIVTRWNFFEVHSLIIDIVIWHVQFFSHMDVTMKQRHILRTKTKIKKNEEETKLLQNEDDTEIPAIYMFREKWQRMLIILLICVDFQIWNYNNIGGVMFSVLVSSAVNHGFEPRSGQTKDNKIGICCFSAKHATLKSKCKDYLARHHVYLRTVVSMT